MVCSDSALDTYGAVDRDNYTGPTLNTIHLSLSVFNNQPRPVCMWRHTNWTSFTNTINMISFILKLPYYDQPVLAWLHWKQCFTHVWLHVHAIWLHLYTCWVAFLQPWTCMPGSWSVRWSGLFSRGPGFLRGVSGATADLFPASLPLSHSRESPFYISWPYFSLIHIL